MHYYEDIKQAGEKGRGEQEQLHKQLPIQGNDTIILVEADKGRIAQ
jgi:hypothetical protein